MRRSTSRRAGTPRRFDRRVLAAAGTLLVFGAIAGVTQISRAATNDQGGGQSGIKINGLDVLANSCKDSKLQPHDGFQKGDRCVSTAFGEVASAANDASLLIVKAPKLVNVGQAFTLEVSTRNLIRDRFLGAAAGGYYVESSVLAGGIERGHFHTACRLLPSTKEAPPADPVPDFFVATEDKKGSRQPDVVQVNVTGIKQAGDLQCSSWAGDGSHRVPMMERANQTPAIDSVRITVRNAGGNNNGGNNNGQQGNNNQPGNNNQQPGNNNQQPGNNNQNGQNGNNQNQNNGQQNNGQQGNNQQQPPATTPAQPPKAPDTKSDVVTPPKTTTTTKSTTKSEGTTTTKSTTKTTKSGGVETTNHSSVNSTATGGQSASNDQSTIDQPAADDQTATNDQSGTTTEAAKTTPVKTEQKSGLALTGSNTMTVAGIGVIILVLGLVVFATTRRRRGY